MLSFGSSASRFLRSMQKSIHHPSCASSRIAFSASATSPSSIFILRHTSSLTCPKLLLLTLLRLFSQKHHNLHTDESRTVIYNLSSSYLCAQLSGHPSHLLPAPIHHHSRFNNILKSENDLHLCHPSLIVFSF